MKQPDINVSWSGEGFVVHAEGQTQEGTNFLDSYLVDGMNVVDSGHITLPHTQEAALLLAVSRAGLTVHFEGDRD